MVCFGGDETRRAFLDEGRGNCRGVELEVRFKGWPGKRGKEENRTERRVISTTPTGRGQAWPRRGTEQHDGSGGRAALFQGSIRAGPAIIRGAPAWMWGGQFNEWPVPWRATRPPASTCPVLPSVDTSVLVLAAGM